MKCNKKSKLWISGMIMTLVILYLSCLLGYAEETLSDVRIQVVGNPQRSDESIQVKLGIEFNNLNYYNDQVYLSYHVLNENDEVVKYDNERIEIELDEDGKQNIALEIDMTEAKQLAGDEHLYVEFDFIDLKGAYWFSTSDMDFETTSVAFHRTLAEKVSDEIQENVVIFSINVVVFIMFCLLGTIWYKKNKY